MYPLPINCKEEPENLDNQKHYIIPANIFMASPLASQSLHCSGYMAAIKPSISNGNKGLGYQK
jgi:hypothetical protein